MPAYSKQTWVPNVTPVDAAHMNHIEDGIVAVDTKPSAAITYIGAYDPAHVYADGDYVVGVDGITYQCVIGGTVGVTPVPWATYPVLSYGTSLPASPVDGQEAILVDSVTAPNWQWRFRYNAGSTWPHKWDFIGGPPWENYDTPDWTLPSGWNLSPGPRVVVPRTGTYQVEAGGGGMLSSSTGGIAYGPNDITAGSPTLSLGAQVTGSASAASYPPIRGQLVFSGGVTLGVYYIANITGITIQRRRLSIIPVRVS